MKRERLRAERCWLKSKLTVHKQIYENIKKKVTDLVDNAKTAFYSFKIQTSNSCKEMFYNFSAFLGKKNFTPLPSSSDIPQAFSEYFTNKIITIRNKFPPVNPTVAMDKTTYSGKCYRHSHQSLNSLFWKFSKSLSPNHAILIPFPQNCCAKTSTVQSQTCHLCLKFLKRSFYINSLHTSKKNNLCNPFQSAYRTGHSRETALLRVVNDFLNAMDEAKICVLLLLDLSAAFNTIDHQILLSRLETAFGIRSTALQWFRSPSGQKSVRGCQQFFFLYFSSHVWCSIGLSAETCAVFVHYSTVRHHRKSLSQPSAFCIQHPTSKINSTKWRAKPYTRPAIMYRWHKSMDVQQQTQT